MWHGSVAFGFVVDVVAIVVSVVFITADVVDFLLKFSVFSLVHCPLGVLALG